MDIPFSLKIYDNIIEIIPDGPIEDNSVYDITFDHIKAFHKMKTLSDVHVKVSTKMTPAYASLESVLSLVDAIELPEDRTLYYIREASRRADYLSTKTFDEQHVPFEVNQFVKYLAAHETLLKFFIDRSTGAGLKGTMGEIAFETTETSDSLKDLLNYLAKEAKRWEQELMGADRRKGAAPKAVTRSNPAHYATRVTGYNREVT